MGIRYYAYAFDADQTARALADPRSILSDDPLADAWGLEPGAQISVTTFEQSVPATEMLYLDKAWRELQDAYAPTPVGAVARPAYRMFEGDVTMNGYGWDAWIRVLTPAEVAVIADDLCSIVDDGAPSGGPDLAPEGPPAGLSPYASHYLDRAREFMTHLAGNERGMVYMIG